MLVSEMDSGFQHSIDIRAGRQAYLVNIEGDLQVNGGAVQLGMREAMTVQASSTAGVELTLQAGSRGSHIMIIEMQQ